MADRKLLNVLLVDDSRDDLELLLLALRGLGVVSNVRSVTSGNEAIRYIRGLGPFSDRERYPFPSFIITDLKMADGDGFALLEDLQSMPEHRVMQTVVMSASTDQDDIRRSYALGAASYLVKPIEFGELVRMLRALLEVWAMAELPAIDSSGRQLATQSEGKLGERFAQKH